ncbi:tRNA 2-thiouridine(34) synthase MnmA [Candidatus Uhrbacteria bacterium]|nr:tRNA 2-thiouridine(34) synthase MnmA [Candidatus Uhrbacteria bacterium]
MGKEKSKTIFVGLSGGVDSSIAAALLQREGHVVHGVYLKVWSPDLEDLMHGCPWEEDVRYAEATARHLGIPFAVWDVSKEYFGNVVEYFVSEHRLGRTPNPDIMCNREIKFGIFLQRALRDGADMIATGHYVIKRPAVRVQRSGELNPEPCTLYAALDKNKDQSYFLYTLNQDQLAHALFPIGEYTKPEVRKMANEWGLPTAVRKDSQGICFLGKIPVKAFLERRIPSHAGALVTSSGRTVGAHDGVEFYTIGQRHGIGSPGGGTPFFVAGKDAATNTVIVAEGEADSVLYRREICVTNLHWISGVCPQLPLDVCARIRYRQPLQECVLTSTEAGFLIHCKKPQRAVTPGQAIVFYTGEEMIGGGVIDASF